MHEPTKCLKSHFSRGSVVAGSAGPDSVLEACSLYVLPSTILQMVFRGSYQVSLPAGRLLV